MSDIWTRYRSQMIAGGAVLLLLLLPLYLKDYPYRETIVTGAFFWAIMAASWSLLAGTAGQFSFAHMAFMGIGVYTAALLERDNNASVGMAILYGTLAAGLVGAIIGALTLRLRTAYLALFTIAFSELLRRWLTNEFKYTGGRNGLKLPPLWDGITRHEEYYVMLALLIVSLWLMQIILSSRMGIFLRAIREDQEAAAALGINVVRYKVLIFVITSMFAGLAGAVFYHQVKLISPDTIVLLQMGTLIAMAVIGGIENIYAAGVGAFFIRILQESLRGEVNLGFTIVELGAWRMAAFGLIMILTLRFAQNGLLYPVFERLEGRAAAQELAVSIRQRPEDETEGPDA